MPKRSPLGIVISFFALAAGFCVVWHIWVWAALSLLCAIAAVFVRTYSNDTEESISAAEVERMETAAA